MDAMKNSNCTEERSTELSNMHEHYWFVSMYIIIN